MKFAIAALLGLAGANITTEVKQHFLDFMAKHGKSYPTTEEFQFRLAQFAEKFHKIKAHNAEAGDHADAHKLRINHYADRTDDELVRKSSAPLMNLGGGPAHWDNPDNWHPKYTDHQTGTVWTGMDWTLAGAVVGSDMWGAQAHGVTCVDSNYAFAAKEAVESKYQLTHDSLVEFSAQQIIDCDLKSRGCNGGSPLNALNYLKENSIMRAKDYKYTGYQGHGCNADESKGVTKVKEVIALPHKYQDPAMLKNALKTGPVVIGVDRSNMKWAFHDSGVMKASCGDQRKDFETVTGYATLVGYGTASGFLGDYHYWIVKGNEGPNWGSKGYAHIKMVDKKGTGACNMYNEAYYPVL